MIFFLIAVAWLVFGTFLGSLLLFQNDQLNQVLGVTFSTKHAQHAEVKDVINSFKKACYLVFWMFVLASLLMLLPAIEELAEFVMLLLVMGNMAINGYAIGHHQRKLRRLKERNDWIYPTSSFVSVDLMVTKEQGKASISPVWVWLLFGLGFIPMIVLVLFPNKNYPLFLSVIGPICQLPTVFLYYQSGRRGIMVAKGSTQWNLMIAQNNERINSIAATLSALVLWLFSMWFNAIIWFALKEYYFVGAVIVLIAGLLVISFWQQRQTRKILETAMEEMEEEIMQEKETTWKWGCYHNPYDSRLFVPKRLPSMGWTINIAHPLGKAIFFGTMALATVMIGFIIYSGTKDYEVTIHSSEVVFDAAMYDYTINKNEVASISMIEVLPKGRRTSGFGGFSKSYGHFSLDGYGNGRLYVYNKVKQYVVVSLKGDRPSYIIVNGKSAEETQELHRELQDWFGK